MFVRRWSLLVILCLVSLATWGSSRVTAQGTPGTAHLTRWDIFTATGGEAGGGTRNIRSVVLAPKGADPEGFVWLYGAGPSDLRLGRLDPANNLYTQWNVSSMSVPRDLAVNRINGDVWMSAAGVTAWVVKSGDHLSFRKYLALYENGVESTGVAADADGNAWGAVPFGNGVFPGGLVYIPRNPLSPEATEGYFFPAFTTLRPYDVVVDNGAIWFTNTGLDPKLGRLTDVEWDSVDPTQLTATLTQWPLQGSAPTGLRVSGSRVCVAHSAALGSGAVECIDTANDKSTLFEQAPGQGLDDPQQVAMIRNGELFVTERGADAVVYIGEGAYAAVAPPVNAPREVSSIATDPDTALAAMWVDEFLPGEPAAIEILPLTPDPDQPDEPGVPIGDDQVRFQLPEDPGSQTSPDFPQPIGITDAFVDPESGHDVVFVGESFSGPNGDHDAGRIDRFEFLPPQDEITVSPATLEFTASVDDTEATPGPGGNSFTVTYTGTLQWTATPDDPDVPPFGVTLAPTTGGDGDEVTVTITSIPEEGGTYTRTVYLSAPGVPVDPDAPDTVTITLTVSNADPDIEVEVLEALDFVTNRDATPEKMITVRNRVGGSALEWQASITYTGGPGTGWLELDPEGGTEESGDSTPVTVSIANHESLPVGDYEATITITSNDSDEGTIVVPVKLKITAPMIAVTPDEVLFGSVLRGATPTAEVVVTNDGNGTLTFTPAVSSGDEWLVISPSGQITVPSDSDTELTFTAHTADLAPGTYEATVTFVDNVTGDDLTVDVSITVEAAAVIGVRYEDDELPQGTPIEIEVTAGGATPVPLSVEIVNEATGNLGYGATVVSGGDWLSITGGGSGTASDTAAAPLSLSISDYSDLDPGEYTAIVRITSDDAGNSPYDFEVHLTVVGGTFQVTPNPLTLSAMRTQSATGSIKVENTGGATLNFTFTETTDWLTVRLEDGKDAILGAGEWVNLIVTAESGTMLPATYTANIRLEDPNASNAVVDAEVRFTVRPAATIVLSSTVTAFATPGGPLGGVVTVTNSGDAALCVILDGPDWLAGLPAVTQTIEFGQAVQYPVNIDMAGLTAGVAYQTGVITASPGIGCEVLTAAQTLNVSVTVTLPPVIQVDKNILTFETRRGQNPPPQIVQLTNPGGQTLDYEVQTTQTTQTAVPWLVVTPTSGQVAPNGSQAAPLNVQVNSAGLNAGTYTGSIVIYGSPNTPSADVPTQTIVVTLDVKPGTFTIAPQPLSFDATRWTMCNGVSSGTNPPSQNLTITNTGNLPLAWTASASTANGGNWLSTQQGGIVPPRQSRTIRVSTVAQGLGQDTYSGAVTVDVYSVSATNPHGIQKETEVINVNLNVGPAPATLCVTPRRLDYGPLPSNSTSSPRDVMIENVGDEPLDAWTATVTQPPPGHGTINLSQTSGSGPATVQVSITTTQRDGPKSGKITITAPGAQGSPQQVDVTWIVRPDAFTVVPGALVFNGTRWTTCNAQSSGTNPAKQLITVTNLSSQTVWYTASAAGGSWLSAAPTVFSIKAGRTETVEVAVDVRTLAQVTYNGNVTINAWSSQPPGSSHNPAVVMKSQVVPVTLNVAPAPVTLCVSPTSLAFGTQTPNSTSTARPVQIQNVGDGIMGAWTSTDTASRGSINVTPANGIGPATAQVTITTTSHDGSQSGKITFTSQGAAQSPQVVTVTWKVQKPKSKPHNHHGGDCSDDDDHDDDGDHDGDDHNHHHGRR